MVTGTDADMGAWPTGSSRGAAGRVGRHAVALALTFFYKAQQTRQRRTPNPGAYHAPAEEE
jgi:hypothetical protein